MKNRLISPSASSVSLAREQPLGVCAQPSRSEDFDAATHWLRTLKGDLFLLISHLVIVLECRRKKERDLCSYRGGKRFLPLGQGRGGSGSSSRGGIQDAVRGLPLEGSGAAHHPAELSSCVGWTGRKGAGCAPQTQEGKATGSMPIRAETAAQREATDSSCPPSGVWIRWREPSAWRHLEGIKVPLEAAWQDQRHQGQNKPVHTLVLAKALELNS